MAQQANVPHAVAEVLYQVVQAAQAAMAATPMVQQHLLVPHRVLAATVAIWALLAITTPLQAV
jgi:hypothetical protein